jgi:hypothetical protein
MIARHLFRPLAAALAICAFAAPAAAQDDNPVCGPDSFRFDVSKIGPHITGQWTGTAPGIGVTMGVQTFTMTISMNNGRLYISDGARKAELRPMHGTRKALRYDFLKGKALPKAAHAVDVSVDDFGLVLGCDMNVAPQFAWTFGAGSRRSDGIYSFGSPHHALGTMWNSARGAREVYLSR